LIQTENDEVEIVLDDGLDSTVDEMNTEEQISTNDNVDDGNTGNDNITTRSNDLSMVQNKSFNDCGNETAELSLHSNNSFAYEDQEEVHHKLNIQQTVSLSNTQCLAMKI
jgi:hypothetical protein